jgi:hypothetical protein
MASESGYERNVGGARQAAVSGLSTAEQFVLGFAAAGAHRGNTRRARPPPAGVALRAEWRYASAAVPPIGRNFFAAAMPNAIKAISTIPCATANGASVWVGASAWKNATF